MNVLLVNLNQVGQGTYWRALSLGRELVRRGHAVTLLATSRRSRTRLVEREVDGVRLVETPDLFHGSLRSGWDPWNALRRVLWLRGRTFDLVHAFESRPTVIFPSLYAARRGAALVMDWCDWFGRGGSVEERPNPLVRAVLRPVETFFEEHYRTRAQGTTVICTTLREKALRLGLNPESILMLPNGADVHRLEPLPQAGARERLGLPAGAFLIGYVGSIFRRDAEFMARAIDRVRSQLPEARLLVAGYCPVDVRTLVQDPQAVIQTGRLDDADLNAYLAAADLFWLPLTDSNANRGRFPLKLTDYLAVGRPVVATAVGDVPRFLEDGATGLLSPDDPAVFAEKTIELAADPARREAMGCRAREAAETRLAWSRLAEELEGLYKMTLAERRA